MLDKLPPAVRHAILMLIVALLTWAQTGVPGIETLPLIVQGVISTFLTLLIAALTPLTTQYGAGQPALVDVGNAIPARHDAAAGAPRPDGDLFRPGGLGG